MQIAPRCSSSCGCCLPPALPPVTWCQSHPCPAARGSQGTTAGEALLCPIFCCICSHTSGFGSPGGFGFLILLWTQQLGRRQGAFSRLAVVASVCSRVPFLSCSSVHEGEPPLIPSSWLLSSLLVWSSSAIRNECFRDKVIFLFACFSLRAPCRGWWEPRCNSLLGAQ